jgi:hypothetical protein
MVDTLILFLLSFISLLMGLYSGWKIGATEGLKRGFLLGVEHTTVEIQKEVDRLNEREKEDNKQSNRV